MYSESIYTIQNTTGADSAERIAERLINIRQVSEIVGLSRSVIYRLIREGKFPPPLKITKYASRWKISEINQWIDSFSDTRGVS